MIGLFECEQPLSQVARSRRGVIVTQDYQASFGHWFIIPEWVRLLHVKHGRHNAGHDRLEVVVDGLVIYTLQTDVLQDELHYVDGLRTV